MGEQLSPDGIDSQARLGPVLDRLILASSEGLLPPETGEIDALHLKAVIAYAEGLTEAGESENPFDQARATALPDLRILWEAQHASLSDWMRENKAALAELPKLAHEFDQSYGPQLQKMNASTFAQLAEVGIFEPDNGFLFGSVGDEDETPMIQVGNAHNFLIPTLAQVLALASEESGQYKVLRAQTQSMVDALGAVTSGKFITDPHSHGSRIAVMQVAYGDEVRVFDSANPKNNPQILMPTGVPMPTLEQMAANIYGLKPQNPLGRAGIFVPNAGGIGFLPKPDGGGKYFAHQIDHPPLKAAYPF